MKITKRQLKIIIKEAIDTSKMPDRRGPQGEKQAHEPWPPLRSSSLKLSGHEYGDDNLKSTARLRQVLESGELDWLDDYKSSAVMRHLEQMRNRQ